MVDFGASRKTLLTGFILLAYSDILNSRTYDLVGVDQGYTTFKGYHYNAEKDMYDEVFSYKHKEKIHLVIPGDFTGTGSVSYVLVTKKGPGEFDSYIYFRDHDESKHLGESTSAPLLYACPEDLRPQLLMQCSSGLKKVRVDEDRNVIKEPVDEYGKLHRDHTSAFVELDGSMKACLCLVVDDGNGGKLLRVLSNRNGEFVNYFEMSLPNEIGPIVFGDFNGNGMNDMAFVQKSGEKYLLKIYFNSTSRVNRRRRRLLGGFLPHQVDSTVFSEGDMKVVDLSEEFPNCTPVLKSDDHFEGLPYGIFNADLRAKGRLDFFIVMKDMDSITRIGVLENNSVPDDIQLEKAEYHEDLFRLKNVISISCCDYNNKGREAVFLNRVVDNDAVVEAYRNDLSKENLKLSLSTIHPENQKYGSVVPGVSYLVSYGDGERIIISNQVPYSTFVHLKHHVAYIGLGTINLIVDSLMIGTPGKSGSPYAGPYVIDSIAIPNTDLVVYLGKNEKYTVEAHFIVGDHFRTIIGTLLVVAGVNLAFILLLQYRDRRRIIRAKNMDKLHPLFSTLQ
ncbi:hypothetical protein [Encephalitozoon cuniculi GB-M1]|uniref:Uncharacterized protein n=2 Tax=Encephalitozoon cuniculi TaxID=6035 RepID=Q8SUC0_ENCCU|nr:uncharacterized protein ECU10_1400 [Encephalitozoon cuniculi GB-M1]AGE96140.1 hypothetical protein ECU10_1400 [Encephalitozoon cuniculi]KMV65292.1 hypothetical protein M970_101330 [Encephalitozoon cuniculi EcunIII-L]UYI26602.1 WD40 domain-containing protein [Encephalitozoon cuniculi]CAD25859.1 hypothetical protein [Encephalitozoon cuniculi GB-M1]